MQYLLTDLDSAQEMTQKGGLNFLLFGRELRLERWDGRAVQLGGGGEPWDEITACPRRQRSRARQSLELSSAGSARTAWVGCFLWIAQSCLVCTVACRSYRQC